MISWLKYVPHADLCRHLAQGWEIVDELHGVGHGEYSTLMKATDNAWLPVIGWEGLYEVSRDGRIRSVDRMMVSHGAKFGYPRKMKGRVLKPNTRATGGYHSVMLHAPDGSSRRVHVAHVVAASWLGPRPHGSEVCHNNGVRSDNRADNLRYDSRAGNEADKLLHGTLRKGEAAPAARLTEHQVREIRRRAVTEPEGRIAIDFGVCKQTVQQIISRRIWGHLETRPDEAGSPEMDAVRRANIRQRWSERMSAMNKGAAA